VALSRQCDKDRNFYKWVRGVVQLPEFRGMFLKHSTDPEVWKAGVGMALEALRNPPPSALYTEFLKVATEDPIASKHTPQLLGAVLTNMPGMAMTAVTPGTDLTPLSGLLGDIAPQGANVPMVDSTASNRYWSGYKRGYDEGRKKGGGSAKK
jgi:hypothetical protein